MPLIRRLCVTLINACDFPGVSNEVFWVASKRVKLLN